MLEYRVFGYRFVVLALFCSFSFAQSWSWFTYAGFPPLAQAFYGVSSAWINFYLFVGPAFFVLGTPVTIWLLDKRGLRATVVAASVCVGLSGACKALALLIVPANRSWPLVLVGQSFASLAGPAAMAAPPKISSVWFGPKERSISTSIAVVANISGTAAGFLFGLICMFQPAFSSPFGCSSMQLSMQAAFCLASTVSVVLFFRNAPPSPPSFASDRDTSLIQQLPMLRKLLRNGDFVFLALAAGCSQGIFSTWTGLLDLILASEDPLTQALAGFAANVSGMVGAIFVGWIASLVRLRYKLFMVILFLSSGALFTLFNLFVERILPYNFAIVLPLLILGAFLFNATYPLFFELGVELAYPAPEGLVGSVIAVLVNIFGMPVYFVQSMLPSTVVNWVNAGNAFFFGLATLFLTEKYLRNERDEAFKKQLSEGGLQSIQESEERTLLNNEER